MTTIECPHCGEDIDVEDAIDNCCDNMELEEIDCGYYRVEIDHECEECGKMVLLSVALSIADVSAYPWDDGKDDYDYDRGTESD